jgi:hypothetical protein
MTRNIERESRIQSRVEFWVLVVANAGLIAMSMLGLVYNIVRLFN